MAKKITFLLVLLLGLMLASISAYATTDTGTTAPDTGLTNDKVSSADNSGTIPVTNTANTPANVETAAQATGSAPSQPSTTEAINPEETEEEEECIDYEQCVSEFLDPDVEATDSFLVNIKWNQKDPVNNPLLYVLTGTIKQDSESGSPLVVMLYIKADELYIPLMCRGDTNIIETGSVAFVSRTDLLYLGSDRVNEVRIIAFRKEDADNLIPGANMQISDKVITAKQTVIIPIPINTDSVLDALKLK